MCVKYSEQGRERSRQNKRRVSFFLDLLLDCVLVGHATTAVPKPGTDPYVSSAQSGDRTPATQIGEGERIRCPDIWNI